MNSKYFYDRNDVINDDCVRYHIVIENYAKKYALPCTYNSLNFAAELHYGQFRDGGSPYIIHPLSVAHYLVMLEIQNAIYDMKLNELHDEALAKQAMTYDLDILLSVALLHDSIEDCADKLTNSDGVIEFPTRIALYPEIFEYVLMLTKNKKDPGYTLENYFQKVCSNWITLLVKIIDRTDNCSTINAFNAKRMEKYVRETVGFFYPMCSQAKALYPDLSRIITIAKYFLVSVCETAASALNLVDIINAYPKHYEKTYSFIKGFSIGSTGHQNTLKALPLAKQYYADLERKSGDPFIIHPLRVTSYLISLKVDDDIILASALLHEIIKRTHLEYNGIEIVTKYHLETRILDHVRLMSNTENYPLDIYYEAIKQNPDVLLAKLSNRANTCTYLIDSNKEEIKAYIEENEEYIYPLCEYGIKHYPQYSYAIQLMYYHISSISTIVKSVKNI